MVISKWSDAHSKQNFRLQSLTFLHQQVHPIIESNDSVIILMREHISYVSGVALILLTGVPYYVLFVKRPFELRTVQRFWGKSLHILWSIVAV